MALKKRYIAGFSAPFVLVVLVTYGSWLGQLFCYDGGVGSSSSKSSRSLGRYGASSRNGAASSGATSSASASSDECAGVSRYDLQVEWVEDLLKRRGYPKMPHSTINEACPKFVFANQNYAAGIGHRLTQWTMALHTAVWFNITFVHTSLDGGSGAHGNYNGWDSWLAFTKGEWGLDDVMARPGIKRLTLPSLGGYYLGNEEAIRRWKDVIGDPAACNIAYEVPQDQWMFDITTTTKPIMAYKYLTATKDGGVDGAGGSPHKKRVDSRLYDYGAVNVAVHIRIGDQYPTPEHVEARVVSDTILPELRAAGVRAPVHVHVFAEHKGAETFPTLAALGQVSESPQASTSRAALARPGGDPPVFVHFWPEVDPLTSFWHFTEADFLVMSFSSFSWAAAHVAMRPVCYSQPSSDIYRMCGEYSACCLHSGDCTFMAKMRTKQAAQRLAKLEACGGLR